MILKNKDLQEYGVQDTVFCLTQKTLPYSLGVYGFWDGWFTWRSRCCFLPFAFLVLNVHFRARHYVRWLEQERDGHKYTIKWLIKWYDYLSSVYRDSVNNFHVIFLTIDYVSNWRRLHNCWCVPLCSQSVVATWCTRARCKTWSTSSCVSASKSCPQCSFETCAISSFERHGSKSYSCWKHSVQPSGSSYSNVSIASRFSCLVLTACASVCLKMRNRGEFGGTIYS